jgi:hypothetical protein
MFDPTCLSVGEMEKITYQEASFVGMTKGVERGLWWVVGYH